MIPVTPVTPATPATPVPPVTSAPSALSASRCITDQIDIQAVIAGEAKLTLDQAMLLYHKAPLPQLGRWANEVTLRIHGPTYRTYVIDRNINYTNICSANCTFCAFKRDLGDADSYILTTEQLHQKVQELVDIGGTQILLQGGMHPKLPLDYYVDMLGQLKQAFPQVHVHGFSPPEFVEFVAVLKLDGFPTTDPKQSHTLPEDVWQAKLQAVMSCLQSAGLDSIPGGGGEIFTPAVRKRIGLGKATTKQWLDVMACAHRLGMSTSATMMFGHIESVADRIDHMLRVRDAQQQAIDQNWPGRYMAFISWPFQRENTPMGRLPLWDRQKEHVFPGNDANHHLHGKVLRMAGASEYLRMQAISRLIIHNIHSIGASWVTMGPKIGQLGLLFGANDMGSVMMEENVVSAAGTTYCLDEPYICHLIRTAGLVPAQRDNDYRLIRKHANKQNTPDAPDTPDTPVAPVAPDLAVTDWSQHRASALAQQSSQPQTDASVVSLPTL